MVSGASHYPVHFHPKIDIPFQKERFETCLIENRLFRSNMQKMSQNVFF
jgi:hypothetical protein